MSYFRSSKASPEGSLEDSRKIDQQVYDMPGGIGAGDWGPWKRHFGSKISRELGEPAVPPLVTLGDYR